MINAFGLIIILTTLAISTLCDPVNIMSQWVKKGRIDCKSKNWGTGQTIISHVLIDKGE
jgi:hypothetical protein